MRIEIRSDSVILDGYVWPRYNWKDNFVNARTINYITKYVAKKDHDHQGFKP